MRLMGQLKTDLRTMSTHHNATATTEESPTTNRGDGDRAVSTERRFFLRMDDHTLALEDAVQAAQDGDEGAVSRIGRLRSRILKRVNDRLLTGGDTSVGGNLLL